MENPQGHWAMATACLAIRIYRQIYQDGNHKEMPQKLLKGLFAVLNLISGNPVFINDDICKKNKKGMNGIKNGIDCHNKQVLGDGPWIKCFQWVYSAQKGFTYVNGVNPQSRIGTNFTYVSL